MIKGLINLSSKKRLFKKGCGGCGGSEGCKSYPTFKVSSCPGESQEEPGTVFTPVYGSLYTPGSTVAIENSNFDFTTDGPSSGVTLNTTDNSITVNSPGVYTISFSTSIDTAGDTGTNSFLAFRLSINLTPDATKEIALAKANTSLIIDVTTLSRTDQLLLDQGDVIRIFIETAEGNINYSNAALVVTKVA